MWLAGGGTPMPNQERDRAFELFREDAQWVCELYNSLGLWVRITAEHPGTAVAAAILAAEGHLEP